MSRYRAPKGPEVEAQPGSHGRVLRNLRGLTTKTAIDQAEYAALLATQERYLSLITRETRFTTQRICCMHRDWLGAIYAWAGQYRTVEVAKDGFSWPPAYRIAENMQRFSAGILAAETPCAGKSLEAVCRSVAVVHAELLFIHRSAKATVDWHVGWLI